MIEAHRNEDAAAEYETLVPASRATGMPELEVRALVGAGRTQMRLGALRTALDLLNDARGIVEAANFSDLERAEVSSRSASAATSSTACRRRSAS